MSAEDRLDILEELARSSYASDERHADACAERFVDDGALEIWMRGGDPPQQRMESRDAVHTWSEARYGARPEGLQIRHHQRAAVFDALTPEVASTRTMILVSEIGRGDHAPRATTSGVCHDEWRKTQRGRRLALRATHLDRAAPSA